MFELWSIFEGLTSCLYVLYSCDDSSLTAGYQNTNRSEYTAITRKTGPT
jgi:hypothetical protein